MDKPSSEKSKTEPKVERCSSKRSVEYESFNKMIIKREREKERERERERGRERERETTEVYTHCPIIATGVVERHLAMT